MEPDLRAKLSSAAAISALVGSGAAARIHPVILPQNPVLPAISYQRIDAEHVHDHGGMSGLAHARMQLDCWDDDYAGARDLAEKVRLALDGFTGVVGSTTFGAIWLLDERDLYDDAPLFYRRSMDFDVWYQIPTS